MVNITKIKELCKTRGIKQGYLCAQLGVAKGYFNDVERGKNTMPDERIHKIAKMLDTSYDYLTDQTDDPAPIVGEPIPQSELDQLRDMATELLNKLDEPDLKAVFAFLQAKQQTP